MITWIRKYWNYATQLAGAERYEMFMEGSRTIEHADGLGLTIIHPDVSCFPPTLALTVVQFIGLLIAQGVQCWHKVDSVLRGYFSELGFTFYYYGDTVIWVWPWERGPRRDPWLSLAFSGTGEFGDATFPTLKALREEWNELLKQGREAFGFRDEEIPPEHVNCRCSLEGDRPC